MTCCSPQCCDAASAGVGRPDDEGTTVDFWDLTKVLFRRWMITVPMLVLTVGLTVLTLKTVQPDWVSTCYVNLVLPTPAKPPPGQSFVPQRNPFLGQSLSNLGDSAIVSIQDLTVMQDLKAAGLSDAYTVEMGQNGPMVKIEVTAKSPAQADATANELVKRYSDSVVAQQTQSNVAPVDLITAHQVGGNNVVKSGSNVKRVVVAVFAAGLLLTIAVTVGIDAFLRRRNGPRLSAVNAESAPDRAIGMVAAGLPEPAMGHRPLPIVRAAKVAREGPDEGWYGKQPAVYQTAKRTPSGALEADYDEEKGSDDATIVIPNFLPKNGIELVPKNGVEIIPPPSEWLVNDRDGDS
jgi:capsular polysaccharide biosynthesis protein